MVKLNTFIYNTIIAIALSTSFSVSANRPAMENEATNAAQEMAQEQSQRQQAQRQAETERALQQSSHQAAQERQPGSAVDRIMQQQPAHRTQHQTTNDILVLPPKEIHAGETINIKKLDVPRRGIKMDVVRRELGKPIAISASVGQPPITRWTYPDRVVYFEYSTVLHVVAR